MNGDTDVNCRLIRAVRAGNLDEVRRMIDCYGLSYSVGWAHGYVLLRDALQNRHKAVAELLLTSGCRVNSQNSQLNPCDTALHMAAEYGDAKIVEIMLDHDAHVNAKNRSGETPLHVSIKRTKLEVTRLLLRYGADPCAEQKNGSSALHIAASIGCIETVKSLVAYGARSTCNFYAGSNQFYIPLHHAVERGNIEVVAFLASEGSDVNNKAKDDITPLHIAANRGYTCIAEELLKFGASVISSTSKEGSTPLHLATKTGHEAVVKLLLEHGAKVDDQEVDGKTTLYLAVKKGSFTIVEDVLKYCPDINNRANQSSLKIAVENEGKDNQKIVLALLEYGFTINPEDANDPKLLHTAVKKGYLKIVEHLLKHGANVNMLDNSSHNGFTPLHTALKNKQEEVAQLLISYEADINAKSIAGYTAIFFAIENADAKITKQLLTNRANVKNNPQLLHIAVQKLNIEIIEALLQHDVDVNASDKYGRTALHFIASDKIDHFSFRAINVDPDPAIRREIAKLLLNRGANINAQMKNGSTPLHGAAQLGYGKLVDFLEWNIDGDIKPLRGDKEMCTMFLNKGADINAKQQDGSTALHIATKNRDEVLVKLLLEYGAKVDCKTENDDTALHMAAQYGCQVITKIILKFGAYVDCRDKYRRTALHIASGSGYPEIVAILLEYGSDINITNSNNLTPFNLALARIRNHQRRFDDYYDTADAVSPCEKTVPVLERHIIKMKTANLYVSAQNLRSIRRSCEANDFKDDCEKEIAAMKSEEINNANISYYDILVKSTRSLAIYMRNENIVQVLQSDDYKTKFPIYAGMINTHFRKSMERKELLEQGNIIIHSLFPDLPYDCTEKIFSYLSDEDVRILINPSKPFGFSNPDTNINDVEITSNVSANVHYL